MTPAERAAMKRAFPDHLFIRVRKGKREAIYAVPKKHADEESRYLPGWTFGALHGATINLDQPAPIKGITADRMITTKAAA